MKRFASVGLKSILRRLAPALPLLAILGSGLSLRAATAPDLVTLQAGAEWIPLKSSLEIEPGSALDFSRMGFHDAPAGKHGWMIARPDGQFAFEKQPDIPRRFYGINLCFSAQYLENTEADRLADRLVRLGYNSLRIHHYERDLISGQSSSTSLNPRKLEQFDYLAATLIQRGIYLTTDLYVSRPVPWREIGEDREGNVPMNTFKVLVPVHEGAWQNWMAFAQALLDHTNPFTGRRYADEPGLPWLCLINEGNLGNFFEDVKKYPAWKKAWNQWLNAKYDDETALAEAWKKPLPDSEVGARGEIDFPENLWGSDRRTRDCIAFLSDTEFQMVQRMKKFLREDLGCRALISNANSWTYFTTDQKTRDLYDYVDDHFYVDHPRFLERDWRLPSRSPNTSPIAGGASGGRSKAFTRLHDKPFTITEYNYSAPGKYRGVGGILTGAMGALQGWSALWRFSYSHSRENLFTPSRLNYFDMVADPLGQASERASMCLFLRQDMKPAPSRVGLLMTRDDLDHPADRIPRLAPDWHWAAWVTRIGGQVVEDPSQTMDYSLLFPLGWKTPAAEFKTTATQAINPYELKNDRLLSLLRQQQILTSDNPTDPDRNIFHSATGEISINAPADTMLLDTPRTAGGCAPEGVSLLGPRGGVTVEILETGATVWVSALDDQPIRTSGRMLVTHLTDLQNSGIRYAEAERQTLLDWGELPHLVRAGQARVSIALDQPEQYRVWALAPDGNRLGGVSTATSKDKLVFTADVAGAADQGARMLYEVVRD